MRGLIWLTVILAGLWGGWWLVGSRGVEAAARGWFDAEVAQGRVATYETLEVVGFPSRFDLTITAPVLADPAQGMVWRAPFAQVFAMSWKPWHLIAALPGDQELSVFGQEFGLDTDRLMASLLLVPGPDLALSEAVVEGDALVLTPKTGVALGAKRAVMSIRAEEGAEAMYRLGLAVDSLGVEPALAMAAGLGDMVEAMALDATVTLSAPLDRHAGQMRPALRGLDLTGARVLWGDLKVFAKGALAPDDLGFAAGEISVRVENWRLLPPLLVAAGVITSGFEPSLTRGLEIMAARGENPEVLVVPLVAKGGRMSFGPLPLGPAFVMGE